MTAIHESFSVATSGEEDIVDITGEVVEKVRSMDVECGIMLLSLRSTTSSIVINENESGLLNDVRTLFREAVPSGRIYGHDGSGGDGNGRSHLKSVLAGSSISLPVAESAPVLGTWQSILLVEWDTRERKRTLDIVVVC